MTPTNNTPNSPLYLITPPSLPPNFPQILHNVLLAAPVAFLQLRIKPVPPHNHPLSLRLREIAAQHNVPFIVNDSLPLAVALQADGVHLGQSDGNHSHALNNLKTAIPNPHSLPQPHLGITCHNQISLAHKAQSIGASLVAFGAFHPSTTKLPPSFAQPKILSQWQNESSIPAAAIGGVNHLNAPNLIRAGAKYIAVSADVFSHKNPPLAAARLYNAASNAAAPKQ